MWTVRLTPRFERWLFQQDMALQIEMAAALNLLAMEGPHLGRPYADTLKGAGIANLKELRVQSNGRPVRAFFIFDPRRNAIVLCAANKKGENEKRFYRTMIATAKNEYATYLLSGDNNENA